MNKHELFVHLENYLLGGVDVEYLPRVREVARSIHGRVIYQWLSLLDALDCRVNIKSD